MENRKIAWEISKLKEFDPLIAIEFGRSLIENQLFKFHIHKGRTKGFGASFDLHEAFYKAKSEYFERRQFFEEVKVNPRIRSSSGFASHGDQEKAELAALFEVIERDAFMLSWLTRFPPVWLEDDKLIFQHVRSFSPEIFQRHKVEIKIGFVAEVEGIFVAVSALLFERNHQNQIRFAVDTSANSDITLSLNSAYKGALIRLESYLYSDRNVARHPTRSPLYHLFSNCDSLTWSGWFMEGGEELLQYAIPAHTFRNWTVRELDSDLHIALCEANVQKYYCGPTDESVINSSRLLEVFPSFDLNSLNYNVHPLP